MFMKPGFIEIDKHVFYGKVWPRIKDKVDAMVSNLANCKAGREDTLIIEWGYKEKTTGETTIVAVSHSRNELEKHWVIPTLSID
jgi:hypothetical protein